MFLVIFGCYGVLNTIKFKRRDDIFHVLDIVTKTVGGITYKVEKDESISICPLK